MKFSLNAVKAGTGILAAFGIALGLLIYHSIDEGDEDSFGSMLAIFGLVIAMIISPIIHIIIVIRIEFFW